MRFIDIILWICLIGVMTYFGGLWYIIGFFIGLIYTIYLIRNNDQVKFWVTIENYKLKEMFNKW